MTTRPRLPTEQEETSVDPRTRPTGAALPPGDTLPELQLGQRLGDRYVIEKLLGAGGMGVAYLALDERLGERVALKIMHDVIATETLRDEVRLAQKVTHTNVCRTYDLEEADGFQFVKMEYVAGETLAARLTREPKLAIETALSIGREIANGLYAAHLQGIVHRDLKPTNVMLATEGRVVLMDFGIARLVTAAAGIEGTVGYMAPEQLAGGNVDGRADLYALGCLMYRMVAGGPVFGSGTQVEIISRHVANVPPDVRAVRPEVPRWLARAIASLLAKTPERRPAGYARLRGGPRRVRSIAIPAGVAIAAAAAVIIAAMPRHDPHLCRGSERRLAGVWDADTKAAVKTGFLATQKPYAASSYAALEHALDGYANGWTDAVVESCEATRVRRDQTEDSFSLRADCLDQRLEELRAFVHVIAGAASGVVDKGDAVVVELQPVAKCANVALLRETGLPPPEKRVAVAALEQQLAAARAEATAGRYVAAAVKAAAASAGAKAIGWKLDEARAELVYASAIMAGGNYEQARASLANAVFAAIQSNAYDTGALAAMFSAALATEQPGDPAVARVWLGIGDALVPRIGDDPAVVIQHHLASGAILTLDHDLAGGIAAHEEALAASQRAFGAEAPVQWIEEVALATTLTKARRWAEARAYFEHALQLRTRTVGTDHPDIAIIETNLGVCYRHLGERDKARRVFEHALATREAMFGKQSPVLIATLDNFASLDVQAGDLDGALAKFDRALAIAKIVPGTSSPSYHTIATDRAEALAPAGRVAEAHRAYDDVLALETAAHSTYLPVTLASRAELAATELHWADAVELSTRSISAYEAAGDHDGPDLARPLALLGAAQVALGHTAEARAALERAIAVGERAHLDDGELAVARTALAKLPAPPR